MGERGARGGVGRRVGCSEGNPKPGPPPLAWLTPGCHKVPIRHAQHPSPPALPGMGLGTYGPQVASGAPRNRRWPQERPGQGASRKQQKPQTPRPPPGSPRGRAPGSSRACRLRTCPRHSLTPALQCAGLGARPFGPWLSHLCKGLRMGGAPQKGEVSPGKGLSEAEARGDSPLTPGTQRAPLPPQGQNKRHQATWNSQHCWGPRRAGVTGSLQAHCERRQCEHPPTRGRGPRRSLGWRSPGIHESRARAQERVQEPWGCGHRGNAQPAAGPRGPWGHSQRRAGVCAWAWGGGPADTTPKAGKSPGYSLSHLPSGAQAWEGGAGADTLSPWGPGEDPLQLGKESQGTHSPSREVRHTPWDWSFEKALFTRYRVNKKNRTAPGPPPGWRATGDGGTSQAKFWGCRKTRHRRPSTKVILGAGGGADACPEEPSAH